MLNKFETGEKDLPPDDPRFGLMSAWADVGGLFRQNRRVILPLIGDVNWLAMTERRDDPDFNYAVELETRLQTAAPEFTAALGRLRQALDAVAGWHITWRQYERGEVVDTELHESPIGDVEESVIIASVVRGPAQYHLHEGWIVSSQAGMDNVMGGIGVWVEVGSNRDAAQGISFSMDEMHAIELTRPDQVAYRA